MSEDPIVIVGAARTPVGVFQGALAGATAAELGATAIKAAIERGGVATDSIDEVLMGCILTAGQGQAPARQAAIGAGLADSTPCTTVNKMCGSALKTVMMAHDSLAAGSSTIAIAGGMESMSNAPYLLPKARSGYRMGHQQTLDHMFFDGLEDAYDKGCLMGVFAERTAEKYNFSRDAQDEFAKTSVQRAQAAVSSGAFEAEVAPHTLKTRKGETIIAQDEPPGLCKIEKISQLRPAFQKDGTVTAANASSIADGGAALVLMRRSTCDKMGLSPLAKILGHTSFAHAPDWFTTAPVGAMQALYKKTGLSDRDIDLYEINEAFACVTMAAMHDLKLSHEKVNVHGGACALGHPIGASGARILVTLLHALQQRSGKRGIASLCIGGGEAVALAIELL